MARISLDTLIKFLPPSKCKLFTLDKQLLRNKEIVVDKIINMISRGRTKTDTAYKESTAILVLHETEKKLLPFPFSSLSVLQT